MSDENIRLSFITPYFGTGADQTQAELRVPAIRGQLRWWFRVLGGDAAAERRVFGGMAQGSDDKTPQASRVCLRIATPDYRYGEARDLPEQNQRLYYLAHYAGVSEKKKETSRSKGGSWLAPESSFELRCIVRRSLDTRDNELFQRAWRIFLLLGTLGLRQTRGFGAVAPAKLPTAEDFVSQCRELFPAEGGVWMVSNKKGYSSWKDSMVQLEAALGWLRQHGFSAGRKGEASTPLGRSAPQRQASALHLRPVQTSDGFLSVLFYTPQILGPDVPTAGFAERLDSLVFKTPYEQKADSNDQRESLSLWRVK